MTARLNAYKQFLLEYRKPRYLSEKPYKSISPPKVKKQKLLFDFATNIRIDNKSAQGTKRKETAVEHLSSPDIVVKRVLQSPASELRLSPHNELRLREASSVKNRLAESIELPHLADSPVRHLNKYGSDLHMTFAKSKIGLHPQRKSRV